MPDFLPFPALRYATPPSGDADLSAVCAPPYDVIEPEDRASLLAAEPRNAVRLILPDSYAAAADLLARWQADGTLIVDDTPTFSIYRMHFTGDDGLARVTTGVIGALELDRDGVLPHERTLPKAKSDRLELLRATRANFDPIWGLSLATGLSELLEPDAAPVAVADDRDGVRHECYPITDPVRLGAIRAAVSASGLVLADGHHRFETACTYYDERRRDDVGAGAIMTLVVELAPEQLCVRAIHRLLTDLPSVRIRDALASVFDVRDAGANDAAGVAALEAAMQRERALGLVDAEGLALLVPRAALDQRVAELAPPLRDVDAARFDAAVLPALPGVSLAYRDDAATVAAAVEKGNAQVAVLLRPVEVETIRAAAAARLRMPEKTTFFAPKPRTGMVFRSLDL
ncbi:MAG: DUF1015 domain-containing protein [Acidimicrobiia bacterium]